MNAYQSNTLHYVVCTVIIATFYHKSAEKD